MNRLIDRLRNDRVSAATILEGVSIADTKLDFLQPSDKPGVLGTLGSYEITEVIGRGGMGVVLKGFDARLNRFVAVKVLAPETASNATARRRFLREAQAAAAISHDHVVTIHAVDESERLPYLVMEYVSGMSLQELLDRKGALELKAILRIGMQTASGLAAAHAQGLVHRDIKPANILLENGVQRVKITDFGLARAVDDVGITQTGVVTGTPLFMSPEQARGESIDHRTDLFSLGSVLYAMCTGRAPFRAETTMGVLRRVCEDTPRPIQEVNAEIPDWLCAIVERLLEKNPDDRFQSAAEVADVLAEWLAYVQQPASVARPVSIARRKRPWTLRKAAWLLGSRVGELILGIVTLCAMVAVITLVRGYFFGEAKGSLMIDVTNPTITEIRLSARDEDARRDLKRISSLNFLLNGQTQLNLPDYLAPGLYQITFRREGPALYEDQAVVIKAGRTVRVSVPLSRNAIETEPQFTPVAVFDQLSTSVARVVFASDGETLACTNISRRSGTWHPAIRLWDVETGESRGDLFGHSEQMWGLDCSPDGDLLVSASHDGTVKLWDVPSTKLTATLPGHDGPAWLACFSPDGQWLATGGRDKLVRVWDVASRRQIAALEGHLKNVNRGDFSADGKLLATSGQFGELFIWDTRTWTLRTKLQAHEGVTGAVQFAPSGSPIATAGGGVVSAGERDQTIKLWDASTGDLIGTLDGAADAVESVAFSPDGAVLVSVGGDWMSGVENPDKIRVWDVETKRQLVAFDGHDSVVHDVAFSPDGELLATCSRDRTVKLWGIGQILSEAHSPGAKRDTTASANGDLSRVREIALADRIFTGEHAGGEFGIYSVAVTPDGKRALTGHYGGAVCLWDVDAGTEQHCFEGHTDAVVSVAISANGRYGLSGSEDGSIRLWDLEAGDEVRRFEGHTARVHSVAFSPEGEFVLSGSADFQEKQDNTVRLWNRHTGEEVRRFPGRIGFIQHVAFSPNGELAAAADGMFGQILLWNVQSGHLVQRFNGFPSHAKGMAFTPDGRFLVSGHIARQQEDGVWSDPERCVLRVWDLKSGRLTAQMKGHSGSIVAAAISPDGRHVLSASSGWHDADGRFLRTDDQTIRLWELASGREVCRFLPSERVFDLAFLPDGKAFLSAGDDSLRLWELPGEFAAVRASGAVGASAEGDPLKSQ